MQKQVTERQRKELARRKAMGIALIQRPLKHIRAADSYKVTGEDGVERIAFGPAYTKARIQADQGHGAAVQRIARQVL